MVTHCIDLIDKHLEILNEQKNVTSEAVQKTIDEGGNLLEYLKEQTFRQSSTSTAAHLAEQAGANNEHKQHSNSYNHFEGIVTSIRTRYQELDKLLSSIKQKLESNLQIKMFEKDALEACQHLEQWSEELKYMDENEMSEQRLNESSTESWLQNQIQTANQMQVLVFELLQRGSDLVQTLERSESVSSLANESVSSGSQKGVLYSESTSQQEGSQPSTPNASTPIANQHTLNWIKQQNMLNSTTSGSTSGSSNANLNHFSSAKQRIQSFIEYMNEREKELHDLAIKQQRRLGQTLQINQLENDCVQVLSYISNIEMSLFSMLKFARNLDEAEHIKKEHEMFKSSLEAVSVNVNILQTKSQRILIDKQQQQQQQQQRNSVSKFEQLMNTLNSKWQILLIYIDNRTRLIMAQINFYKYTDQVTTVLESLEHEYTREEDWYEKSMSEYDPEQYLQTQLQVHNQKKQSFLKACNWARRTGETFQKYSARNICDAKLNASVLGEIETNTKKIMDDIHNREERTIKSWNSRKNALDECFQYVIFEKSSKEALAWLHESEMSYLNKFQNLGNNKDEMKKLYKEFCEFTDRLKNQQGYVNLLIELSPKLLESSIRYGNSIAQWASKVETRYKEFFNVMSKVQQAYGMQVLPSTPSSSSASPMTTSTSGVSSSLDVSLSTTSQSTDLVSQSTNKLTSMLQVGDESMNDNESKKEMLKQNEQKQKMIKKRQNIISEIINTEKTYVQDLSSCLDTYFKEFVSSGSAQPEYLRGKEAVIFGNLEEIYNFHKKTFLVELENYENMPEDIGHCFVVYADQFQVYVEYCKNKENSTKLLMEDGQKDNFFEVSTIFLFLFLLSTF